MPCPPADGRTTAPNAMYTSSGVLAATSAAGSIAVTTTTRSARWPRISSRNRRTSRAKSISAAASPSARHDGGQAVIAVLDRGPGIPVELVDRLKEPFTRRDAARSGSSGAGLGLAIASRVAELHGGRLDLLPREGGGLEARLSVPLAS